MEFAVKELFFVLLAALSGGLAVRIFRLQPIIGYLLAGIIFGSVLPQDAFGIEKLAELGAILLLFSVGLELSLARLKRIFKLAVLGGLFQIIITILLIYPLMLSLGFNNTASIILAGGFSLSSTAVVVKILADRGETQTVHGEIMIGWLLIQDLAVIPMMVILPSFISGGAFFASAGYAIFRALIVIIVVVVTGRLFAPWLVHKIAGTNSRELMVVLAVVMALGTAIFTSFFGISAALGAFLAGLVISETQENHAVFSETRPLRDLFVALFFVTLGFMVKISMIFSNLSTILLIVFLVMLLKALIFAVLALVFKYHGRTAITAGLGLAQIGEFSFVIFSQAAYLNILPPETVSVGIAITIITLLFTSFLFKLSYPVWRKTKDLSDNFPILKKYFSGGHKSTYRSDHNKNHIIICGYGRIGKWVVSALDTMEIKYMVVDYNQTVVEEARKSGINVIYGDPSQTETLEQLDFADAKAVIVAIPDRFAQEELITNIQSVAPSVKIFSRAHFEDDVDRLKFLRVDKIVQPEFEAAVAIVKSILYSFGKPKEEVLKQIKRLRLSHSMKR